MRLIGHIKNEAEAKVFGDFLTAKEIRNQVEPETDGSWAVWVFVEEQLNAAQQALAQFLSNPKDPRYVNSERLAAAVEERERQKQADFEGRTRTGKTLWPQPGMGWCTMLLMGISVAAALFAYLSPESGFLDNFFISLNLDSRALPEVRHGEIWRLITPIFLHGGIPHLLFNMLALRFLGGMIEARMGSWKLLWMVLLFAVPSNIGQYLLAGPAFGGMSGVLYGLFGFIWIRGKIDPRCGLYIDPANTMMMIAWFFLCLLGVIPHVANAAHGFGLAAGIVLGGWPAVGRLFQRG